jgi:hypothetical protein
MTIRATSKDSMTPVSKQLDVLLAAVAGHELPGWDHPRLMGALTMMSSVSERAIAEATMRLVARELRGLQADAGQRAQSIQAHDSQVGHGQWGGHA